MQKFKLFPMGIPVLAGLLIVSTTVFGAARSPGEVVAPLLNDSTFLVARIDLSKLNLEQVEKEPDAPSVGRLFARTSLGEEIRRGFPTLLNQFRPNYQALLKEGNVSDFFLIASTDYLGDVGDNFAGPYMKGIPFVIAIPVADKTKAQQKAIQQVFSDLSNNRSGNPLGFPVRFTRHDFYFAIFGVNASLSEEAVRSQKEIARVAFGTLNPKPRPEINEAFTELADDPIQIVLIRPAMFNSLLLARMPLENIPFLQPNDEETSDGKSDEQSDPFAGKSGAASPWADKIRLELAQGISWTAIGFDPAKQRLRWIVKADGKGGAKRIADTVAQIIDHGVDWAAEDAKYRGGNRFALRFQSADEMKAAFRTLVPKAIPNKNLLALTLDETFFEKSTPFLEKLFLPDFGPFRSAINIKDTNKLKTLTLAMHNYHDAAKSFPASSTSDAKGKPLQSWRIALLPYLEQSELYEKIKKDEPWDSPYNQQFHAKMPDAFASPFLTDEQTKKGVTNYVVVVATKKPKPADDRNERFDHATTPAFSGPNRWSGIAAFMDGLSNTLLIVERTKPVCWMDPEGDLTFEVAAKGINKDPDGLGSPTKDDFGTGGINVAMGDGSSVFLPDIVPEDSLKAFLTRGGGESWSGFDLWNYDGRPERPRVWKKVNTAENMKRIVLGMHVFHDAYNRFPNPQYEMEMGRGEEKRIQYSWRVRLLPFIEQVALYDAILSTGEPWDSESNKRFHAMMPDVYRGATLSREDAEKGLTTFAMVYGGKSAFESGKPAKLMNITDGTSNTLIITERKTPVNWMDPEGDIPYEAAIKGLGVDDKGIGAPEQYQGETGVWSAFFDGSTHFLPKKIDLKTLKNIIEPTDGNVVNLPVK